ncbi:glycosyltransferase family 4 protein [Luteolibacter algae]|uniref:Glycosyltransferase family 4 protein n=1 Tax=Luteolibacter algae TaxID=454151 RepID=A0ABW5D6X8_9BACT
MKINLCILQGAFLPVPPCFGGAVEKRWFILAQELVNLGCNVTHISKMIDGYPTEEHINGVRHVRVKGFDTPSNSIVLKMMDFFYSRRAVKMIPRDIDVVVTNSFFSPILLPTRLRSKVYVDVARMPKGQMKLYNTAAKLRGNSTPVAEAIKNELPLVDHDRVTMVPNPLPFVPSESSPPYSEKSGLLYCGRIHPEKGIELCIDALRLIESPPELRIVGPWRTDQGGGGEVFYQKLKRKAEGLPVTFIDPIFSIEDLNLEYKRAAGFVYPSLAEKGETFGLAPLEAMAWGCVPIVSDLACFKDFIKNGSNGLIFNHRTERADIELADAIGRLLSSPELSEIMSQQALNVRVSHSVNAIAKRFLEDFKKICKPMNK